MLVIYVICAVFGFVIYTGIKLIIDEWLNESRMSRLSLKKPRNKNRRTQYENIPPNDFSNIIEISDDESDASMVYEISDTENQSAVASTSHERYNAETLAKFQKSTDSIGSDEDEELSMFGGPSSSKPKASMFDWNPPSKSVNRAIYDSDSSDDFNQKSNNSHSKQGKKKFKTYHKAKEEEKTEPKEEVTPEVSIQYEQMISGIKVKFPVKPYSSQMAVMNKVIQGCMKSENCLLESPTGTGKTLALLCSVLAWHDHHSAQVRKELSATSGGGDSTWTLYAANHFHGSSTKKDAFECENFEDKMDFEQMYNEMRRHRIPKIYYCTRTHKQIEQVIREFNKTAYTHKKMTILSSRDHSCIQESTRSKTELCNELLDPTKYKGCQFYNELNKKDISSFEALEARGLNPVWDIEDLVAIGKEKGLCPYFAARNLMEHADIVFCPYNYIIDPDVRESMQLSIKDEVIILDEAHNIENHCREVASVTFREDHLMAAAKDCEILAKQREMDFSTYNTLNVYITKLAHFLKTISLDVVKDNTANTLSSPYWSGAELLELFNMHKLGESDFKMFLAASKAAIADVNKMKEESRTTEESLKPIISTSTQTILGHLVFSMRMITSEEFVNDYRACVMEKLVKDFKHFQPPEDVWLSPKKQEAAARSLELICMNPGVIFAPLSQSARSIILASGTLTPVGSFQSELSTKFPHVLNAGHVIPRDQVYATYMPKGPNGIVLKANYQNVNSWSFQDELGLLLLQVCESIPHGVLCFFSSYTVMHKQMERWRNTSTWDKISSVKKVFIEPRYGGDLTMVMQEYCQVIEDTSPGPVGKINGALLLAVFRGKVAEGIDFKDNEARCVMTVGIPFAVRNDPVVDMKFKYNDANVAKGLLKGSEWYSTQAFRALNQALGRCLRHANDWGAVLLVDERFSLEDHRMKLPKWVKTMCVNQNGCDIEERLRNFVARQKEKQKKS